MSKFDRKTIANKIHPIVNKIQTSKLVNGITGGMMGAMPITILGAFAALFLNLPIPAYKEFIASAGIAAALKVIIMFTTNFLAVIFGVAIAGNYAKQHDEDGLFCGLLALLNFFIVTPVTFSENGAPVIPMQWLGGTGIFTAIIVSLLSTWVYIFFKRQGFTIKMPASVPPVVSSSFSSLIPGFVSILLFSAISVLFAVTPFKSMHQFIYAFLQLPLQGVGGNIASIIILWTLAQLLWFMGIHGTMVIYSVVLPIFTAMDAVQLAAYSAGEALPNITGRSFVSTYTMSASAIGLTLLMLFFAKSQQYKTLGKLTTIPALFGISEPLVFGTPMVFNFRFAIPFIFMNAISLSIAYLATYIGLVPRVAGITPITGMPIILSGIMEGSWKIAVLQVFLVGIQIIVWYPFFKKADKESYALEMNGEGNNK
ncbi:PTS cellbiose transporter subunit IIC [Kosakonia radicincitans DSM 16656]|uniref:PTS sugar transporter subunit IIC n=1 Tax=Kosakonia TaxID=1330547 RepID=UPI0002730BCD|nr:MULTISPECIES: PTS transporter subunit EIIC [Kosakonia]ARD62739.1 PTS cellbiose transporter subunit IIC [Kosakonia radicincitans DSM 16656]KDE33576.1 PTS cellbiose transporter subunit IIC [Kosakonia radicincitans UMEnt01/12]MDD7994929.1 PTS transporter subunit EIIC [Kosakonia radicincitans]NCF08803.1 PTS sugar transporter subunit IIC [Kosakonia sp. MH5]PTA90300.1 PTS sugar transporter subunit IIC [Kosakonia sp. H7A]